jgi:hypothetical protein
LVSGQPKRALKQAARQFGFGPNRTGLKKAKPLGFRPAKEVASGKTLGAKVAPFKAATNRKNKRPGDCPGRS